jgi:hypothetical protein
MRWKQKQNAIIWPPLTNFLKGPIFGDAPYKYARATSTLAPPQFVFPATTSCTGPKKRSAAEKPAQNPLENTQKYPKGDPCFHSVQQFVRATLSSRNPAEGKKNKREREGCLESRNVVYQPARLVSAKYTNPPGVADRYKNRLAILINRPKGEAGRGHTPTWACSIGARDACAKSISAYARTIN